jgi:uncharacterized membrane protein
MEEVPRPISGYNADRNTGPFALVGSQARYVVERGEWAQAAQLEVGPAKFAYVAAVGHFARAIGAAAPVVRKLPRTKRTELRDKLRETKHDYRSQQVDIQAQSASSSVQFAEHGYDAALNAVSAAADTGDKTEKATVTPGAARSRTRECRRQRGHGSILLP